MDYSRYLLATVSSRKKGHVTTAPQHQQQQQGHQQGGHQSSSMDASFVWKIAKLGRVGSSHLRFDDDWVDRLNYQITCFLHFVFIGVLGIRSYIGKPIQCWAPQEFNKAWEEYSENFCWVSNTFYAPINDKFPLKIDRNSKMIGYYQWTPIVLACQALLFYLPCLWWRLFMRYSGFNVRRIIQMASDSATMLVPEMNSKNIRFLARYFDTCIERNFRGGRYSRFHLISDTSGGGGPGTTLATSNTTSGPGGATINNNGSKDNPGSGDKFSYRSQLCRKLMCRCMWLRGCQQGHPSVINQSGRFLCMLYGTTKIFYITNVIFQLYLMKKFLGTESLMFGINVLMDLVLGKEWNHSGNFPRVTFCEVQTKKLGENNVYNLQCVLPLNMFLEKIYIFLWFYYIAVAVITIASLLSWVARLAYTRQRHRFVRHYLRLLGAAAKDTDNTACLKFTENHLRPDGVFILHLVAMNVGHVVAGDLAVELWNIYRYRDRWPPTAAGSTHSPENNRHGHGASTVVGRTYSGGTGHHHHHHGTGMMTSYHPSSGSVPSKYDVTATTGGLLTPSLVIDKANNNNNNNNSNHDDIV